VFAGETVNSQMSLLTITAAQWTTRTKPLIRRTRYFQKRLDHMEPGDIRRHQVHLLEQRKIGFAPSSIMLPRFDFST
jgi:hypothetical protein